MNSNLLFDFTVNKENNTIQVKREFAAELPLVWQSWTDAEILDQWWAPKPWRAETKSMEFAEGGRWHYAMVGPEGEKQWCIFDYDNIQAEKEYAGSDAFADENAIADNTKPRVHWRNRFSTEGERTLVDIVLSFESMDDLEKLMEMGFKEGFTMGLGNLDQLLPTLKK